jgi:hypothetical protein
MSVQGTINTEGEKKRGISIVRASYGANFRGDHADIDVRGDCGRSDPT